MGYFEYIKRNGEHTGKIKAVPWNAAAQRRGKSKVCDTWEEADAYIRRMEREIDGHYDAAGIAVTRQQRGIPLFAEHVVAWARKGPPNATKATLRNYRATARMLAERWPSERVDELTEDDLTDYLAELRDAEAAPSTIVGRITVLRHAFRAAVRAGHRADDPTLCIKGPAARDHDGRILTGDELALARAQLPEWLAPAALLSHDAGLRIGEIAGLRLFRLNLLQGLVTVADVIDVDGSLRAHPKGKLVGDVPLSPRVVAALRELVERRPPAGPLAPVFSPTGEHVSQERIRKTWRSAVKRAKLHGIAPTWHDLRHTYATTLAESGASAWDIMELLRHKHVTTAQRYVKRANLARKQAAIHGAFGGHRESSALLNASTAES